MANWLFTVKLKDTLDNDDISPEQIIRVCEKAMSELKTIAKLSEIRLHADDLNCVDDLNSVIDDFDFLKGLCDGSIPENEWDDYSFDGDFEELCNDYLTEMYDIGDSYVIMKNGDSRKFFWVN